MIIKKLTIKIFGIIIFCFLLFSILSMSSSAAIMDPLFIVEPIIEIEYNEQDIFDPIIPYSSPKNIPIKVKIKLSGINQHIVVPEYSKKNEIYVDLSIEELPEWCKATIYPTLLIFDVDQKFQYQNATVTLTLDKNSPAFELVNLKIRIESRRMGNSATVVPKGNKTEIIPFTVGYIPLLGINELEGNHKVIEPDETAIFPIEIINLGNDITNVKFDILSIPEGWFIDIISSVTIDQYLGKSYKTILNLVVKPPVNFGYHEDREEIKISITPSSNFNPNYKGEEYLLSFFVYNRGFSTPGFETVFLIFGIIIILFIIKKNKSNKCKKHISKNLGGEIYYEK